MPEGVPGWWHADAPRQQPHAALKGVPRDPSCFPASQEAGCPTWMTAALATPRLTAGNGAGGPSTSSDLSPSGPKQTPVGPSADREQAQLNFQRISLLQREQLGRAAQPEGAEVNLDTITPEQLFPGEQLRWLGGGVHLCS